MHFYVNFGISLCPVQSWSQDTISVEFCRFSPCLLGFTLGSPMSTYLPKTHHWLFWIAFWCEYVCMLPCNGLAYHLAFYSLLLHMLFLGWALDPLWPMTRIKWLLKRNEWMLMKQLYDDFGMYLWILWMKQISISSSTVLNCNILIPDMSWLIKKKSMYISWFLLTLLHNLQLCLFLIYCYAVFFKWAKMSFYSKYLGLTLTLLLLITCF